MDYHSGPYHVTFHDGVINTQFNIIINDDNILEVDEKIMLTISPSSLPSGVTVGDSGQTTVTIVNDDSKL